MFHDGPVKFVIGLACLPAGIIVLEEIPWLGTGSILIASIIIMEALIYFPYLDLYQYLPFKNWLKEQQALISSLTDILMVLAVFAYIAMQTYLTFFR